MDFTSSSAGRRLQSGESDLGDVGQPIDPDLEGAGHDVAVVGVDRELMPNLALQANYSWTRTTTTRAARRSRRGSA